MENLPSLNGLRAFEAAARCGSVKAAAAELFVTPGAVSQQVKALEAALGTPLFRRVGNTLQLSEAGAALYPVLHEAFQSIAGAVRRVREREQAGPLTVSTVSSFASKWLVPRLGRFRERHPQIDVRISATERLADFSRDDVDVAIRLGSGNYAGLRSDFLFREPLFPVCSPRLVTGSIPLREPADLRHHTLLHDETYDAWLLWLRQHGVQGVEARRGPVFSDASMALQAAMDGQGVAMARGELAAQDLADGRLVRPFDLSVPYRFAYFVVSLPEVVEWPKVAAFREWVLEQARQFRAEHPQVAPAGMGGVDDATPPGRGTPDGRHQP